MSVIENINLSRHNISYDISDKHHDGDNENGDHKVAQEIP